MRKIPIKNQSAGLNFQFALWMNKWRVLWQLQNPRIVFKTIWSQKYHVRHSFFNQIKRTICAWPFIIQFLFTYLGSIWKLRWAWMPELKFWKFLSSFDNLVLGYLVYYDNSYLKFNSVLLHGIWAVFLYE